MKNNNRKLNYVDVLIAVVSVIVLVIFASEIFKNNSRFDFTPKEPITLTLKVKNIPLKHSGLLKNGDSVFFTENDEILGKIKYISYDHEMVEFIDKLTNASSIYKSPDKNTALMLVEANAEIKEDGYYISGVKVNKSDEVNAFVPAYSFDATVVNIENNKEWYYVLKKT